MTGMPWGQIIGSVASRFGERKQNKAAEAAKKQLVRGSGERRRIHTGGYNALGELYQPYNDVGNQALSKQSALLGINVRPNTGPMRFDANGNVQGQPIANPLDPNTGRQIAVIDPRTIAAQGNQPMYPVKGDKGGFVKNLAMGVTGTHYGPDGSLVDDATGMPAGNGTAGPTSVKTPITPHSSIKMDPSGNITQMAAVGDDPAAGGPELSDSGMPGDNAYGADDTDPYNVTNFGNYSPDMYQDDPSFQFQIDQGEQALQRSSAGRGSQLSGGRLKDVADYVIGKTNENYQQAWDRNRTSQNDYWSRLSQLTGLGTAATDAEAGIGKDAIDDYTEDYDLYYGAKANADVAKGNAAAEHYARVADIWGGGIGGGLGGGGSKSGGSQPSGSGTT